jgi:curli production assembly/transport component CsgE
MVYTKNNLLARGWWRFLLANIAWTIVALTILASSGLAQQGNGSGSDITVSGILIDRTMTPIGQQFFSLFCTAWTPPEKIPYENITIVERFNPQWGSMIWITVDDEEIFEKLLLSRNKDLTELAGEVSSSIQQFLIRRELLKFIKQSNDLKGDGLSN